MTMTTMDPIQRLTRDLKTAARTLSHHEARYLVDTYYQIQRDRIRADHQVRMATTGKIGGEPQEPHEVLLWLASNTGILEQNIKRALDAYTDAHVVGRWSKSIVGIGPVIAAGLLAHIDLEPWRCAERKPRAECRAETPCSPACGVRRTTTAGKIWRFAGLDPTVRWERGQKRPWNAQLKRLCWLIGESFTKVSGREGDVYGQLYLQRKAIEVLRNADGQFAEQAAASLVAKRFRADTVARRCYEEGELPPARVHLRAQRWAVKIFLSHWHHVAYETRFGEAPPKPYVIAQLGHADEIRVPNWPMG